MKLFSKLAIAAVAASSILTAAEVIDLTDKDFWKPNKAVTFGEKSMSASGKVMFSSKKVFEFDTTKKYTFEMDISVGDSATKKATFYVGFYPTNAKGHFRAANNYQNVPASFTEVVEDVKKGDTVIKVKDASKWVNNNTTPIALNAKADFSDLPNTKIYNGGIVSRVKKDDIWVITLKRPLNLPVAAGSFIRQHLNGGYYYVWIGVVTAAKNAVIKRTITGKSKQGAFTRPAFHPSVTHGNIIILADWNNSKVPYTIKNAKLTIE